MAVGGPTRARFPAITVLRLLLPLVGVRQVAGLGALMIVGGVLPNLLTLAFGLLVTRIQEHGAGTGVLVLPLVLVGAGFFVANAHSPVLSAVGSNMGMRFDTEMRDRAMAVASGPAGIAHLEDPRVTDRLVAVEELMHGWLVSRCVSGFADSWTARLRAVIAAGILASFHWWAPVVVFIGYRLMRAYRLGTGFLFLQRYESNTQEMRRASYLRELVHSGVAAKENRVFGIGGWFIESFRDLWERGMEGVWRNRVKHELTLVPTSLALGVAVGFVANQIGLAVADGELTLASAVVMLQCVLGMNGLLVQGDAEWQMHFGAHRAVQAQRLAEVVRTPESDLQGDYDPPKLAAEIRLEAVGFAYPGTERRVLDGLDLVIPAGASLAIVGENGAGKTTLTKLLCRLYDPSDGRILIDGADLKTLDPDAWRRQVAVIFQDFIRYELTARDNIGLGAVELMGDDARLHRAADLAGARDIVDRVGWDTVLSRKYDGGAELSGGEWQRIALARALFAVEGGARLLILDEPTANLDVRAEAALYQRFLEMTSGITTILISHRFSTVRMADHIAVIEGGRVIETGSHQTLCAAGGRYASMFESQAVAYRDGGALVDD